jgi:hypothetical protein
MTLVAAAVAALRAALRLPHEPSCCACAAVAAAQSIIASDVFMMLFIALYFIVIL